MSDTNTSSLRERTLSVGQQRWAFVLGVLLAAVIVGTAYAFTQVAPADAGAVDAIIWASIGGFMGGAARSLYMYIREIGGHTPEEPSSYLRKWFLYLLKPFVGMAGGLFFFLAVNLGLVGFFAAAEPKLDFLRILLTSVTGGFFFEDVFELLRRMIPTGTE